MGSHAISAVYSGDGNFASVSSSVLKQTINPFTVGPPSGSSTSATVSPGGTATYLLSVTPPATTAVSFSISGVPIGASASFNPTTVGAGAGPTNVQLNIIVPSQSAMIPAQSEGAPLALGVFMLPLLGLGAVRRKVISRLLLALACISSVAWLSACGGSSHSTPPPSPQTYTLTVTATAGTLSGQTNLTLTVQR